jgi:hypothetical protein
MAPGIVGGEDLDNQVELAATECEIRQFLFSHLPNAVTPDEFAVETTHAQFTHGVGDIEVIQNLENRIAVLLEAQGQSMTNRFNALETQITNLKTDFGDRFDALQAPIANQSAVSGIEIQVLGDRFDALQAPIANQSAVSGIEIQVLLANQRLDHLDNSVRALDNSVRALDNSVRALDNSVRALGNEGNQCSLTRYVDAKFRNMRARQRNREYHWTPLVVEIPGVNAMGVVPSSYPPSYEAFLQMDNEQMDALELQFNLPRGHFRVDDAVDIRREAVRRYLTLG